MSTIENARPQPLGNTWESVCAAEPGTIFLDRFDEGLRFLIMRGPAALCAYVGIPLDHPLAGHSYDDLPVQAHGGLTFSGEGGTKSQRPAGFFWYGWDYAHSGDHSTYDEIASLKAIRDRQDDTRWTVPLVEADSWHAIYDFKHLLKLSEAIAAKVRKGRAA
jgi:hypothetical protein